MIDPWQVLESRSIGADAILLIVAALEDGVMDDIEATAIGLGMDVLVEVHDAIELERALRLKSRLIGVNNRNLKDFTVDFLADTYDLVRLAPKDCTFVAESGLRSRADLDDMAAEGVRCFLIGEALMRQDDSRGGDTHAARRLMGTLSHTDEHGAAHMVDVSTEAAYAQGRLRRADISP